MKIYFIILLFISTTSLCQKAKTTIIVDKENNQFIPYPSIEVLGSAIGIYSNKFGEFSLVLKKGEVLKVSHLGYESLQIKKDEIKDTHFLKSSITSLDEVVILQGNVKEKNIGYIKKKKTLRWHIKPQTQLATLIKYKGKIKKSYIKKIQIPINKKITGFKYLKKSPSFISVFRVHLYENVNEKPGKNLLMNPILINCNERSNKILEVDISDELIKFTNKGVFVGIKMIGELDDKGGVIKNKKSVLPSFMYTRKRIKNIVTASFIKRVFGGGGWEKIDKINKDFSMISEFNMAISLTLSIYGEK